MRIVLFVHALPQEHLPQAFHATFLKIWMQNSNDWLVMLLTELLLLVAALSIVEFQSLSLFIEWRLLGFPLHQLRLLRCLRLLLLLDAGSRRHAPSLLALLLLFKVVVLEPKEVSPLLKGPLAQVGMGSLRRREQRLVFRGGLWLCAI